VPLLQAPWLQRHLRPQGPLLLALLLPLAAHGLQVALALEVQPLLQALEAVPRAPPQAAQGVGAAPLLLALVPALLLALLRVVLPPLGAGRQAASAAGLP
jgi:hypothetical protein